MIDPKDLFEKATETLDIASGVIDKAYGFIDEWEKKYDELRAEREHRAGKESAGEPVKVKPGLRQMLDDIIKHREATFNLPKGTAWRKATLDNVSVYTVQRKWDELPEEFKTFVKRSPDSPV